MTKTLSTLPSRVTADGYRRTRSSFPRAALTSRSCSRLENHFLSAPHLRRTWPLSLFPLLFLPLPLPISFRLSPRVVHHHPSSPPAVPWQRRQQRLLLPLPSRPLFSSIIASSVSISVASSLTVPFRAHICIVCVCVCVCMCMHAHITSRIIFSGDEEVSSRNE